MNGLLLQQAIELLKGIATDELETVQINNTKYDDGSIGFSVELTYPAKGDLPERYGGLLISELSVK
ncbi:hypothetical protein K0H71_15150 [Bacillus sp. IITD106]|nr:hypothetical protein [Bacillus sp. IITD106]